MGERIETKTGGVGERDHYRADGTQESWGVII